MVLENIYEKYKYHLFLYQPSILDPKTLWCACGTYFVAFGESKEEAAKNYEIKVLARTIAQRSEYGPLDYCG